jgi:hypothetical protein
VGQWSRRDAAACVASGGALQEQVPLGACFHTPIALRAVFHPASRPVTDAEIAEWADRCALRDPRAARGDPLPEPDALALQSARELVENCGAILRLPGPEKIAARPQAPLARPDLVPRNYALGNPLADQLRVRCREVGVTSADLEELQLPATPRAAAAAAAGASAADKHRAQVRSLLRALPLPDGVELGALQIDCAASSIRADAVSLAALQTNG